MTVFLTVEDVNTAIYTHGTKNLFHIIDTANISSSVDFDDIKYDFVKVSRTTSGSNITYTFEVVNENWTGGYCFFNSNGGYIDESATLSGKTISYTTTRTSIKLMLHCFNWREDLPNVQFRFAQISYLPDDDYLDDIQVHKNDSLEMEIECTDLTDNTAEVFTKTAQVGLNTISALYYLYCFNVTMIKSDFEFNCNQTLKSGTVNTVQLGTDSKYKPNGSMIGTNTPHITVEYNHETLPVIWDSTLNDYVFRLDLSDKNDTGKVRVKIIVDKNKLINYSETEVILNYDYMTVGTSSDFINAIEVVKPNVLKIGRNITLPADHDIEVTHNIKIYGNGKYLNLNHNSIIVNEGKSLSVENMMIDNGNPAIIQKNRSSLILTDSNERQSGSQLW